MEQRLRLFAPRLVGVRVVVDDGAVHLPEGFAGGGDDTVGDQAVRRPVGVAHRRGQRAAVDDHGHGLPQRLGEAAGHLVDQHGADLVGGGLHGLRRVAGVQHEVHFLVVVQLHGCCRAVGKMEFQLVGPQPSDVIVPVGHCRGQRVHRQGADGIGAVGQQRGGVHGPVRQGLCGLFAVGLAAVALAVIGRIRHRGHVRTHRHGAHRRAHHRDKVGAVAADGHHEGAFIRCRHLQSAGVARQRVGITRHHVQGGGMGGIGLGIHQPPPGVDEITGGDPSAV